MEFDVDGNILVVCPECKTINIGETLIDSHIKCENCGCFLIQDDDGKLLVF